MVVQVRVCIWHESLTMSHYQEEVNPLQRIADMIICYLVRPTAYLRDTERYVFSIGQKVISEEVRQTFLPVSFDHHVIIRIMTWLCLLSDK
jgi:hypothetical protein